jgi:hypothetical protein
MKCRTFLLGILAGCGITCVAVWGARWAEAPLHATRQPGRVVIRSPAVLNTTGGKVTSQPPPGWYQRQFNGTTYCVVPLSTVMKN